VTGVDPKLKSSDTRGTSGPHSASPDPWGVKRAENLLTSLQGVLSARVEVSPIGEVTAVHVLTTAGGAPKQMVRNVESALLAQLGLKVDHRKISIAQTAQVRPIEALEHSAVKEEALRRGVLFKSVDVVPGTAHRARVKVQLSVRGEVLEAEEEVADSLRPRLHGAAKAALSLLDKAIPESTLDLDAVRTMEEFGTVVVVVDMVDERETRLLTGTAEVRGHPEGAAVLAVLDATNRWVQARTSGSW
jgi:hypothetical protein